MVKPKGILEDLLQEIGLQNSQNIFVWLLASFLLLVDLYFWMDLFASGNFANLCHIFNRSENSFSIFNSCQTILDLVGLGKFLLQISLAILANYLVLGKSLILPRTRFISIARKYNDFILQSYTSVRLGQCSKKSCLTGLIGF